MTKKPKYEEHGEARTYWCEMFLKRKKIKYAWTIKEGARLNEVLQQIRLLGDDDPLLIFKQLVDHYPDWWLKNAYSLHSLSTHFNRITILIKNGQQATKTGVSKDYLEQLARRATGQ